MGNRIPMCSLVNPFLWIIVLTFIPLINSCGPDLEQESFNVYLYPEKGKEELLGEVKGITACRDKAQTRAIYINLKKGQWDYVCCRKTKESDCADKHK